MGAELIFDARNAVGECPVWLASEQALYWVDIELRSIWRWEALSGRVHQWRTLEMPGCIVPRTQGGWLAAMESGIFRLQPDATDRLTGSLAAGVDHSRTGMRFNDGRCDRQGRLRAGTMVMDMAAGIASGVVYGFDGGGELRELVHGLITPNGIAFSPDGRTMYLSDSHPKVQQVWAYDYDIDEGTPTRRHAFIDMRELPGRPDGAAIDEDGCYWICGNDAGLVHRFTPRGELDRSLQVPVKKPSMCAFGGANLDTLFVTSIRPQGIDLSDQPLAGGLFALDPGVRGLAEPACIH